MRRQLRGPVRPRLEDEAGALGGELGERRVVVAGEAHDLAAAEPGAQLARAVPRCASAATSCVDRGGQRREAVLEDDDLVVGVRDLGRPVRAVDGHSGHWSAGGR